MTEGGGIHRHLEDAVTDRLRQFHPIGVLTGEDHQLSGLQLQAGEVGLKALEALVERAPFLL